MLLTKMQIAAMKPFAADLAAIPGDEIEDRLSEVLDDIDDMVSWAEALAARLAQIKENE